VLIVEDWAEVRRLRRSEGDVDFVTDLFDSQVTPVVRFPWPGLEQVCGGCDSAAPEMAARRAKMRD
jgi:hypothetical protein